MRTLTLDDCWCITQKSHMEGRLWWGRLERVQPPAGNSTAARFRLIDPKRMLLAGQGKGMEKNWMPFVYQDALHFMVNCNPPTTYRWPAAIDATDENVVLEFVSAANASARWPYGTIRGGTPGVYDADLDGYVTLFHSMKKHAPDGSVKGEEIKWRTYYMGCAVFAARPPFAVQLMSVIPLSGPDSYTPSQEQRGYSVIFPLGLMLTPDTVVVSYGKHDYGTQLIRFDRQALLGSLQPPTYQDELTSRR